MEIWISIVFNSADMRDIDCELLDGMPTESFRDGLHNAYLEGRIHGYQIRCGNINGGDSSLEFTHNG